MLLLVFGQLESLAADKKPRHPEVLAKLAELEKINQKLRSEVEAIAGKLRVQYEVAKKNETYLKERIREAEQQGYDLKQASSPYEIQKDEAESKRKVYDVVAETMEKLSMGAQLISMNNNVYVLDKAVVPRAPIRPRKLMTLAFGFIVGLLLSVGTVLFLDYLDNTFRSPEDIEQFLGLQILGIIPKYRERDSNPVKEAFQSLRTSILFSSQSRQKRVILFTSAGPQEGKSSTVTLTGRALASAGDRVVVMDCDLRRPTQHERYGTAREPGITNYLLDATEGDYERFLHATDVPTLKVFPCGTIPPNPVDLIGLNKFSNLLGTLKRDFDWVLVDSPPVASLADSVVLASLVDMMAMVIKHNENDRELIRRSLKRLRDVRANVFGAVLNNVDLERTYYGDYYYTGYYYEDGHSKKGRDEIGRASCRERV
jgi:succinoglycan biosynthesis transport protein ExoP